MRQILWIKFNAFAKYKWRTSDQDRFWICFPEFRKDFEYSPILQSQLIRNGPISSSRIVSNLNVQHSNEVKLSQWRRSTIASRKEGRLCLIFYRNGPDFSSLFHRLNGINISEKIRSLISKRVNGLQMVIQLLLIDGGIQQIPKILHSAIFRLWMIIYSGDWL